MGTISEKLTYLYGTKQKLKQAINNIGGEVTDETTFREYANQLENAYDRLPKTEFEEGTEVTLENCLKGKLDYENGVVGIGQSSQDTRQYIDVGTWEQGGINGTTGQDDTSSSVRTGYIEVKTGVLYSITRSIKTNYMVFRFYDISQNYLGNQQTSGMVTTNRYTTDNRMVATVGDMTMTIDNTSVAYMRIADASNDLSTKYTIYTDNTPSPSYPQTINSVTGTQDVVVSGINLANPQLERGSIDATTGEETANDNYCRMVNYIYFGSASKLYFKRSDGTVNLKARWYNKNLEYVGSSPGINNKTTLELTPPNNAEYLRIAIDASNLNYFTDSSVIVSVSDTTYEPYITPTSYQLSLGDKKLYDECYIVGSPDNWKYVDNYYKEKFNQTTIERAITSISEKYRFKITPTHQAKAVSTTSSVADILSNILSKTSTDNIWLCNNGIGINSSGSILMYHEDFSAYTSDQMRSYFANNDDYIVYPLATPIETPITDETLISQLNAWYNAHSNNGTTIITSNGNLPMIIKVRGLKGE